MPASPSVSETVAHFLRYLHYRDHVQRDEEGRGVAGLLRYVAHREQALPEGRLFTRNRGVGDHERHALVGFIRRSLYGLPAHLLDRKRTHLAAAYRFVLSPEDARGLDLRQLTRQIMGQLEQDAGDLPPWIAAEHRNTAHPHIHIVMAARREVALGQFRGLVVTPQRWASMRAAMGREIQAQRDAREQGLSLKPSLREITSTPTGERSHDRSRPVPRATNRPELRRHDPLRWRGRRPRPHQTRESSWYPMQNAFARLAAYYRKEMEREEREMRQQRFSDRDRGNEREWEVYE
jgi:hypothetical protein